MNNGYIQINKPCPICGKSTLVSANFTIMCQTCDCRFIWFKETDKDGNLLRAEVIADPREQTWFLPQDYPSVEIMKSVKDRWIRFYNDCYYKYRDKISCFQYMKNKFGANCMLYESARN